MPERDGYIPGVPCWVEASEPDPQAALDFYGGLFGWEFTDLMPESSQENYFIARHEAKSSSIFDLSGEVRGGDVAAVRPIPEAAPPTAMWNTYFWVDSADESASKVRDAGGHVVREPFEFMNACRMAVFTDPEGAMFGVWEAKDHRGAQLVNDPGAPVFNNLNTRDVEGAKSFFSTVWNRCAAACSNSSRLWAEASGIRSAPRYMLRVITLTSRDESAEATVGAARGMRAQTATSVAPSLRGLSICTR